MAITRTQIAKQLLAQGGRTGFQGGGADFGAPEKAAERAARGYGDPGSGLAATNAPSQDRIADIRQANITLENLKQDKIEEKLEKFRKLGSPQRKFTSFAKKFSPIAMFSSKFGPLNNRDFFTDKVLGSKNFKDMTKEQFANLSEEDKEDLFGEYMSGRVSGKTDAYGNIIDDTGGGDGAQPIIPIIPEVTSALKEEEKEETVTPSYRFMNKGGIADVVGGEYDFESARQMYGLGKLVKKVTRTVKKIAKSPIGKAALLYTAGFGIPGTNFGGLLGTGTGSMFGARQGIFGTYGPTSALKKLGLMKTQIEPNLFERVGPFSKLGIGSGIIGVSALSGLLTKKDEDDDDGEVTIDRGEKLEFPENRYRFFQEGGSTEKEPVAKKTMPLLDMGGKEKDYRETGGFVDMGRMEKADDVPARLSKNEFVFTADAVRNAGDGSVDKGAEVMYNMMKNLEAGGDVSEESQGLEGARKMFQTSQRLGEVI